MIAKGKQKLLALGFKETLDKVGDYNEGTTIYYYNLNKNKYMIFNTFNDNKKLDFQGFDSWICLYNKPSDIGTKSAINKKVFRLSFDFVNDWALLREHIPIQKSSTKQSTMRLSLNSIKKKIK
ncbi:hypothetical protein [Aquimarina macrocephali]|uniref:hypothetical protein n=1 Tax=Aquimarina macrocephali TaxID=666563 RepID=UPI003F67ACC7